MPSTCTFSFDRPTPVYYSGETINGKVTLETNAEKFVQGIYIIFEGKAKVRWPETRTRRRDGKTEEYTVYYTNNETYIDIRTQVFGVGTLLPGRYEYPFDLQLPLQCPSSCTEEFGEISYEITFKLDRPNNFDNIFHQPLSVIKPLDLNQNPEYALPLKQEEIKYFCFWLCSSGPVTSTLTIPYGGWAPGQEIPYKLLIDNESTGYDVGGTKLKLEQTYNFKSQEPEDSTNSITNELSRKIEDDNRTILRLSKRVFEGKLAIPPVPPTTLDDGIINISYNIEMTIYMGDCHTDSIITIPITIGTIPLLQSAANSYGFVSPTAAAAPTAPPAEDTPDTPNDKPPSYEKCLPPSFEEATHIRKKFKDTDKDEFHEKSIGGWIPQYPTYPNFTLYPAAEEIAFEESEQLNPPESRPFLNIELNAPALFEEQNSS